MLILFIRAVILYLLVFAVIRLSGKRELSDLQPFDLVFTLLVADLASVPASDSGIPMLYGVVPILALFLLQQLFAYLSLKLEGFRRIVCGKPVIMIAKGIVQEKALRDSRYTLNDLMEQLRGKDVFEIADVEYAILETNGELSVLLKAPKQAATHQAVGAKPPNAELPRMLVQDGRLHAEALRQSGRDEQWLLARLKEAGIKAPKDLLFAFLCGDVLHVQAKERAGGKAVVMEAGKGR